MDCNNRPRSRLTPGGDLIASLVPFWICRSERRSNSDSTSCFCFFDASCFAKLHGQFIMEKVEVKRILPSNVTNKRPKSFEVRQGTFMIAIETSDNGYFPVRHQHCLPAVRVLARCNPQCLELKPESFVRLAFIKVIGTQALNRPCSVVKRRIIRNSLKLYLGLVQMSFSLDDESVIVLTYLPRSFYRQVHQYSAHVFKRIEVAPEVGLLCKLNQCIGEFEE